MAGDHRAQPPIGCTAGQGTNCDSMGACSAIGYACPWMSPRKIVRRWTPWASRLLRALPGVDRWLDRHPPSEPCVEAAVDRLVDRGDYVVDVGAHHGVITKRLAARVGPAGRVVAVEANPRTADELRRKFRSTPWVSIENCAASDHDGSVEFFVDTRRSARSSLLRERIPGDGMSAVSVPARRLDGLLDRAPALVKLDVEGAEDRALRGLSDTLRTQRPPIIVEFHSNGGALSAVKFLRDHGYLLTDLETGEPVTEEEPPYLGLAIHRALS